MARCATLCGVGAVLRYRKEHAYLLNLEGEWVTLAHGCAWGRVELLYPHPRHAVHCFLCRSDHWYAIREVHNHWWDLNSLQKRPLKIGTLYLGAMLAQLRAEGYSIFIVRGMSVLMLCAATALLWLPLTAGWRECHREAAAAAATQVRGRPAQLALGRLAAHAPSEPRPTSAALVGGGAACQGNGSKSGG